MTDTITKAKTTKKDLEEEIQRLRDDVEALQTARQVLIKQSDSYYHEILNLGEKLHRAIGQIKDGERDLEQFKSSCNLGDEIIRSLTNINEELQRRLNMREAQLNFNLRVMQSITAYKGDTLSVIHGLVESVLSECSEESF